jgi:hypothetical protein
MKDNHGDIIQHVGVKGMKWGVRRKGSRPSSSDFSKTRILLKKRPRELSNDELETINKRLNLEKQYKSLNPRKIDRGRKFVNEIVSNSGKMVLTTAVAGLFTKYGKTILDKTLKVGG